MSEHAWREFLAADGVHDWVVLHGGPAAVFRVRSLADAAALIQSIAASPGFAESGIVLQLTDDRVTVRLTRDVWSIEERHVALARAISSLARVHGAIADRALVQEVQLAIAAKRDAIDLAFWRAVLGYSPMAADNAIDPLGHGSTVWMQELDDAKQLRHAMHVDVSVAREHVQARLAAALAAGGRVVDASKAPAHWTLSDKAGNRVCLCAWPDGSMEQRGSRAPLPVPGDPANDAAETADGTERLRVFVEQLRQARIHHTLLQVRDGYTMVSLAVPGERWEIEFPASGEVEVEIFRSDGTIAGEEVLTRLLR